MSPTKPNADKGKEFSQDIITLLNNVPIFNKFNNDEIGKISRFMQIKSHKPGIEIFKEGDSGDFVCFIAEGKLEILKKSTHDDKISIAHLRKGQSIGEMALIDEYTRSATARTVEKTTLIMMNQKHFNEVLEKYPTFGVRILKGIARHISMNLRKTASRLADYMLPLQ